VRSARCEGRETGVCGSVNGGFSGQKTARCRSRRFRVDLSAVADDSGNTPARGHDGETEAAFPGGRSRAVIGVHVARKDPRGSAAAVQGSLIRRDGRRARHARGGPVRDPGLPRLTGGIAGGRQDGRRRRSAAEDQQDGFAVHHRGSRKSSVVWRAAELYLLFQLTNATTRRTGLQGARCLLHGKVVDPWIAAYTVSKLK